jgi:lysophospholipase L1-like esterase
LEPDLVLIGFGMNDFWSIEPGAFRANVQAIMDRVRAKNPKAEFVLISSIHFDPAYTSDPVYLGHFNGYVDELRSMSGPGIGFLDMASISAALYDAKRAKDVLADPMHPDDFLARWYAQGLVALFHRP